MRLVTGNTDRYLYKIAIRSFTTFVVLAASLSHLAQAGKQGPVFIDTQTAARLIAEESATVLDARGGDAEAPYIPGARVINWMQLRDGWFRTGRLSDHIGGLAEAVRKRGVQTDRPVVVYGDTINGWGEDGRIWWMLTYLGHQRAYIVDGGIAAWRDAGHPTAEDVGSMLPQSVWASARFTTHIDRGLRVRADEVLGSGATIIDARSKAEYHGATPYFSSRGGHIPGAVNVPWRALLSPNGRLKAPSELRRLLAFRGVTPDRPAIAYCTGGVRSAFVVAVLRHLGFNRVANYDGSFWEWASDDQRPVVESP